jgi:putative hydrolase of the HAD superfamily
MALVNKEKIKVILLDSGRTLNMSVTGHWHITPNFFTYVDKKKFNSINASQKKSAFSKAGEYINKQNLILDEAEEYKHFLEYYNIFSSCLPQLQLSSADVEAIAKDAVYNYSKYKFFDDAIKIIPALSKAYKLAVVSDAWPSLENVFRAAGLRNYFSSFVISSKKGITKPHELMYKTALKELNAVPEEAIFIDDSIRNCNGAIQLGIQSIVLCRDWRLYAYNKLFNRNYNIVRNLSDVVNMLI